MMMLMMVNVQQQTDTKSQVQSPLVAMPVDTTDVFSLGLRPKIQKRQTKRTYYVFQFKQQIDAKSIDPGVVFMDRKLKYCYTFPNCVIHVYMRVLSEQINCFRLKEMCGDDS